MPVWLMVHIESTVTVLLYVVYEAVKPHRFFFIFSLTNENLDEKDKGLR